MTDTRVEIPGGVSGRYVRVQLVGSSVLWLAEVQVFGEAVGAPAASPTPTATLSPTPTATPGVPVGETWTW